MNEQLYKKKGRRYEPIGYSDGFTGFPSDGIWLVQQKDGHKSSECIIKIDELDSIRPAADLILGYQDKIIKYMAENRAMNVSIYEYVNTMLKSISQK
jgi:hypothetical protein